MTGRTLVVRIANDDDAEALSTTGSRAFRDAYGGTAPDTDIDRHVESYFSITEIRAELQRPGVDYFIATQGADCAGLAKLRMGPSPGVIDADDAIEVQQLYVSSDHQRKGVGRLLIDQVLEIARARGAAGIWLSVWSEADWATAFYRSCGFVERGTMPFNLGTTEHIDYVMWLPTAP